MLPCPFWGAAGTGWLPQAGPEGLPKSAATEGALGRAGCERGAAAVPWQCHLTGQQWGFPKRKLEKSVLWRNALLTGVCSRARLPRRQQDVSRPGAGVTGGKWPRV